MIDIDIINHIIGNDSEFERWIRKNRTADSESPAMKFIIMNNELEEYKKFLSEKFPIYFFPKKTIKYGMIIYHQDLYKLIFMGKYKFDWEKANKFFDKWLKKQKEKTKNEIGDVIVHINEYTWYLVLYKNDSILCRNLSKVFYQTLENIKNKVSSIIFDDILKNKVFEMFYKTNISFTDMLNELMVLNFYLNEGYMIVSTNHKLLSGGDLDFEMTDNTGLSVFIEVVNNKINETNSINLKDYISGKINDKYREKISTLEDMNKNIIICQTLTPNYINFNKDLVKLQEIYQQPFNLKFKYNTFCFFVSEDNPCFISLIDNKTYINNIVIHNTKLVE